MNRAKSPKLLLGCAHEMCGTSPVSWGENTPVLSADNVEFAGTLGSGHRDNPGPEDVTFG